MSARTEWVDYAKGIGIILVVYGHVARGVHAAGLPIEESWFRLVDSVIYSFHMPLFFFLSGLFFLASLECHGPAGMLASRLRSIAWPYLFWSLLQGLVEVLLSSYTNGSVTPADVASLLWQPRAQFWFLYALFFISVVAVFVYGWLPQGWHPAVPVLSCLAYILADHLSGGVPLNFVIQNAAYFAMGAWFGHLTRGSHSLRSGWLVTAIVVIAVGGQWLFHGALELTYTTGPRWMRLMLAMASVMAVAVFCLSLERYRLYWLAFLGRASLAIYVMHIVAGSGVRIILQKAMGIDAVAVHLVAGTAFGIGLPLLALRLADRIGLSGWLGLVPGGTHAPAATVR